MKNILIIILLLSHPFFYGQTFEDYWGSATAKQDLKDFKGAIIDCDKAIKINPNDNNIYFYRGILKSEIKDYQGAIADYSKAIDIDTGKIINSNFSNAKLNNTSLVELYIENTKFLGAALLVSK